MLALLQHLLIGSNREIEKKKSMSTDYEQELLLAISQRKNYDVPFLDIVSAFDKKLECFNPIKKSFEIEKYFGHGKGFASVKKELLQDNLIDDDWLTERRTKKGKIKHDFKGLYVFMSGEEPVYVGISQGVISRIIQHLKGHSHYTSTLAYNIALIRYKMHEGKGYNGTRDNFPFKMHVGPTKEFLRKLRVAFLPVKSSEELYLFEVFCAMKWQCWLNNFDTH